MRALASSPERGGQVRVASTRPAAATADAPPSFRSIQALRAIAALLVVVHHVLEMWTLRVTAAPGAAWLNGAAGVDVFFVVSGFVMVIASRRIAAQPGGWRIFLTHRAVRIVPLYWLVTTAKLVLVFAFANLALRSGLDLDYVLRSYLLLPVVDSAGHFRPLLPVGWTLTFELVFYLMFALALAFRVDVLRLLVPGLGLIAVAALLRDAGWPAWTIVLDTVVIEFIYGVVLARVLLRGVAVPAPVAACCLVAGFAVLLTIPEGAPYLRPLTWGLPALAIVAGAVSLEARLARALPGWLLALGDASYSIYLTHGFIVPAIGVAFIALHWTGASAVPLVVLVCLMASALAGVAVYRVIEQPILRRLKRRRDAVAQLAQVRATDEGRLSRRCAVR